MDSPGGRPNEDHGMVRKMSATALALTGRNRTHISPCLCIWQDVVES